MVSVSSGGKLFSGSVTVGNGTLRTNNQYIIDGGAVGSTVVNGTITIGNGGNGNSMTIANATLASGALTIGSSASNNSVVVYSTATWGLGNQNITVGNGGATGNVLSVLGGSITNVGILTAGNGTGAGSNTVTVNGGMLDVNGLVCGSGGNIITNTGGIYQFTSGTPTITPNGFGNIALDNGIIAFRNVTNANVKANWVASLTNISFSGVNAFRLNNSTNNTATNQTYTFNNTGIATNYAGLEMINGGTAYTNGSVTIGTAGWLTFSNTAAIMWGAVTNYGTMRIVNSSVIFKGNLTLGEGCTNYWTTNSTALVNGTLTLPTNATLILSPTPGPNDQVTLFTSSTNIVGSPANWTVVPNTFKIARGVGGTNLVARPLVKGFVVIVE